MKKVSISIGDLQEIYGDARALEIAHEIGADAVDFGLYGSDNDVSFAGSLYSKSDDEIVSYYDSIKSKANELGLEICMTHGRLKIFTNHEKEDAINLQNARLDCLATKALGAPYCVMHGVTTGVMGPDCPPEVMHDRCFETFCRILEFAKKYGVIIATETLGDSPKYGCCDFFGNINEFKKIYERICSEGDNADYFVTCVDTGHSNKAMRFGNPAPHDVIRILGKSVKCLHLNDNDTFTDQHKTPGTGTIEWNKVFDALDETGYDGVYNMELNLHHFGEGFEIETAEFAIRVMRYMLKKRYGSKQNESGKEKQQHCFMQNNVVMH